MANAIGRRAVAVGILAIIAGFPGESRASGGQDCTSAVATPVGFGTPMSGGVSASDHQAELILEAPSGCPWTVVSNSPILTVVPPGSGVGNAVVLINVAPNPGDGRSGSVTLTFGTRLPQVFTMAQRGCLSVLSFPPYESVFPGYSRRSFVDAAGGRRFVKVNPASVVCSWPAQSDVSWIRTGVGGFGSGAGIVTYDVDANTSGMTRVGTLRVGYLTFTVRQSDRTFADMNGDTYPDLLWHHQTTGQVAAWLMRGLNLIDGRLLDPGQVADTGWKVVGSGDVGGTQNEDGMPDVIWQHDDGRVAVWWMNFTTRLFGSVLSSTWPPPSSDWRLRAVADLNSDGMQDFIWQHRTTGEIRGWILFSASRMFEATFTPSHVPDTNWQIVGAADFNRDGQVDLLWQNQANGLIAVWTLEWPALPNPPTHWKQVRGLLLNPGQVSDTNWKIRGVMDVDRDGQPDLIWQNQANGLISTWLMDGINLRDGILFSPGQVADTNWVIVGPR